MLHKREHWTSSGHHTVYGPLELETRYTEPEQALAEHSELLEAIEEVRQGDTIEIWRDGHQIAVLVPPGYLEG